MNDRFLELSGLGKTYVTPGGPAVIVRDIHLRIREGEFVCIIGHSGCGKSTVLSILMGLNEATEGGVILAGKEVVGPGLDRGVVFQTPALLPWLTALGNIDLAVEQVCGRLPAGERRQRSLGYLHMVGLGDHADHWPRELSAGMRQRIGIARALALDPKVLLLDEPFSQLDGLTRMELQDELLRLWQAQRKTVVMVTHDVDEALLLADRIVMMTSGPAATVGEIYDVPLPRPRRRGDLVDDPAYYAARERLLNFLEGAGAGATGQSDSTAAPDRGETAAAARELHAVRARRVVETGRSATAVETPPERQRFTEIERSMRRRAAR
jgi:nitrate/nitrite transport system ATP-binding protein